MAINTELATLEENQTWELTGFPTGKKLISTKWLFKTKYMLDRSVERYKAWLVILGNKQTQGIDYAKTFAPVAKLPPLGLFLLVLPLTSGICLKMDVKNSFLHWDLEETVYIKPPTRYVALGLPIIVTTSESQSPSVKLCKLRKSLYGLKQVPRQCFSTLFLAL